MALFRNKQTGSGQPQERDDALFKALELKKKKKKRRLVWTIIIIVIIAVIAVIIGMSYLRRKVTMQVAGSLSNVLSYEATVGSVSTTVSGYGTLINENEEDIELPAGVEIIKVLVDANSTVKKGDVIATVEPASVLEAMSSLQDKIDEIDAKLEDADDETASNYVKCFVSGRVKKIYLEPEESVIDCMYDHGALALVSLDGYMACDIETDALSAGDVVLVTYGDADKKTVETGTVERVLNGVATVLVPDAKAPYGGKAEIEGKNGGSFGSGVLYIHSPLRVTGIAGTAYAIHVKENDSVYKGSTLFSLRNTEYAATFDYLMKQRGELEEDLLTLNELYRDGALLAPFDGTVTTVNYDEDAAKTTTTITYYEGYSAASTVDRSEDAISVITLSPDEKVSATISIDEANILSIEVGQTADVTISAIGDDTFTGTVTEINKTASSSSGVTRYTAIVTMDKDPKMLTGMTARVYIRIQGVDDAIIIPVDALHQTSTTSYVYTSYDEGTAQYGGLVEVEAGISNSSYVEITSGLKEGDTVYYTKKTTMASMFGGRTGGNYGGMPNGGNYNGGNYNGRPGNSNGGNYGGRPGNSNGGNYSGNYGGMPNGGNFNGGMQGRR